MITSRMKVSGPTKACRVCQRELARRHFDATGSINPHDGLRYGDNTCKDCRAKERRANGIPERHNRNPGDRQFWCSVCRSMRDRALFKPHPNREGKFWWCCQDCERNNDRKRYHRKKRNIELAIAAQDRSCDRRRRRRALIFKHRREFVEDAIDMLHSRGFTFSEIGQLTRLSYTLVWRYKTLAAGDASKPTEAVEQRFAEILDLTSQMLLGKPPGGRRRAHPDLAKLLRRSEGIAERHPVRDGWKNGKRNRPDPTDLEFNDIEDIAA